MLNEIYNKIKNGHALKALLKPPVVMGATVGINEAEAHGNIIFSTKPTPPKQKLKSKNIKTMEDVVDAGTGSLFSLEDFPMNFYLGGY